MISLRNSLRVILGANLGTTFTAWVVAALGFKMNIANFSFPFLTIGIVSYLFLKSRPFLKNLGGFLVGFGLLFLGLAFMKVSVENIAGQIDLTFFRLMACGHFYCWVWLLQLYSVQLDHDRYYFKRAQCRIGRYLPIGRHDHWGKYRNNFHPCY